MIEPIMYATLGFLVATLLAIMSLPLVHRRAVRLTTRRIEAATPMSIAEIQAEKDHLRAESAMAMRRLEMLVEDTKAKAAAQLSDLGRKAETIHRLRVETEEKAAAVARLENSEKSLQQQLQQTQAELATTTSLLQQTQQSLSEKEATLGKVSRELDHHSGTADYQRIEIAALRTQIEDLKGHVGELEKTLRHSEERLARERSQAAAAAAELAAERARAKDLAQKVSDLEVQVAAGRLEAETLPIVAAGTADSTAREQDVGSLRAERDRLERQVAVLQQQTDASAAAERMENEMLRERINDVATEVTRLTLMLETEGSPIDAILADGSQAIQTAANGGAKQTAAAALERNGHGSLADRIRALQARAAGAAPNG
jgi:DNA repair exonuclease SbcCD ATPase subunit